MQRRGVASHHRCEIDFTQARVAASGGGHAQAAREINAGGGACRHGDRRALPWLLWLN